MVDEILSHSIEPSIDPVTDLATEPPAATHLDVIFNGVRGDYSSNVTRDDWSVICTEVFDEKMPVADGAVRMSLDEYKKFTDERGPAFTAWREQEAAAKKQADTDDKATQEAALIADPTTVETLYAKPATDWTTYDIVISQKIALAAAIDAKAKTDPLAP